MKRESFWLSFGVVLFIMFMCLGHRGEAQATSPVQQLFPQGTTMYSNIPYAGDTLRKHMLDIYLPPGAKTNTPLIVWIHGGAWMLNDK
jgi:acetyl esterase/lipase